jgi:PAS domain S-box-containing protein
MQALERAARELVEERVPAYQPSGIAEVDAVGAALRRAGVQAATINEELERRVKAALAAAKEAQAQHEALQRVLAEELLALIIDNLPVLISYVDAEGRYRLNNRAYEQWFNRPRSEITGRLMSEVMGAEAWKKVAPRMQAALTGQAMVWEDSLHYPGMGQRWVEISYVPHRGQDGRVEGVATLVHDITARRQAHEELRRLNDELAQADRRKDEFLATLAHELRNPLAPITTALQVMRLRDVADPAERAMRDVIERQVRQLTRLVDDLLDVARITRGRIELRRQRVALRSVVEGAVEAAMPLISQFGHRLELELPDEPVWLMADPARLSQVLMNLLNNAAKYTPSGGLIQVRAGIQDRQAVVRVRDTGIGLAPEHLATVFEMFSQVAPALERSQGGLGIGLALVRGLVQLHGGHVEAHSAGPGQGSEFIVWLPLEEDDVPAWPRSGHAARATVSR